MVCSYLFFLLWFIYLIATSILLFTRGFLLTKESLAINSTCLRYSEVSCSPTNYLLSSTNGGNQELHPSCSTNSNNNIRLENILGDLDSSSKYCLPSRARVVVVIIDALRYDFTLYDEGNKNPQFFQNKLPIIQETLKLHPERTRLYKFVADPPTTTMQRLKALTTGSLPTFIDAGSNFASDEINEDNIIDQVVQNNLSVVFMGDDTWNSLYPRRFKRVYPFPSFNVWDLDSVDRGVNENLFDEIEKKDWNLLIGHYLGVDHAGHRYGPNHPEMARKLREMDVMIGKVLEKLEDDMILYLFGDHGMTMTGDHGGESDNEVSSALFVYTKLPFVSQQSTNSTKQVNIIPTLATVLGVPIPFSNLGSIIHDSLPVINNFKSIPQWKFSRFSIWSNVQQIIEYLKEYSRKSTTFDNDKLKTLFERFHELKLEMKDVHDEESFDKFRSASAEFMRTIRVMCEEVWIEFDSFSISRGLLLLFLSLFFVFIVVDGVPVKYLRELFSSSFLICSYVVCFAAAAFSGLLYRFELVDNLWSSIFFSTGVISQFMLAMLVVQNWDTVSLNWHQRSRNSWAISCVSRLVLAFNLLSLFSNSYIEEESSSLLFLLNTVSIIGLKSIFKSTKHSKFVLFSIFVIVILRLSANFWRCREEQGSCFSDYVNVNVNKETSKAVWACALASLALFVTLTKTWLKDCGSLNDYRSFNVTYVKYAPTVMVVCVGGYWALNRLPRDGAKTRSISSSSWKVDHLVWTVYGATLLGVLSTVYNPLMVYVFEKRSDVGSLTGVSENYVIPEIFRKVKGLMTEKKDDDRRRMGGSGDIPIIYGLGTVFSNVFVVVGVYLTILVGLVLGEATAPSAVVMFLVAAFVLIVVSVLRMEMANRVDDLFEIPNTSILIWTLASHYFFYATGHQAAWSNIDWNAAFVGTSGPLLSNTYVQGALVVLNTFGSYVVMGFLLPLLAIAPFTISVMAPALTKRNVNKELHKELANRGELVLYERNEDFLTAVLVVCCKYSACHGIRVFATMLAATVHCRHLMVWKLFAPKFIFESVGMLVTLLSVILGYLVLVRTSGALDKFVKKLNKSDNS